MNADVTTGATIAVDEPGRPEYEPGRERGPSPRPALEPEDLDRRRIDRLPPRAPVVATHPHVIAFESRGDPETPEGRTTNTVES